MSMENIFYYKQYKCFLIHLANTIHFLFFA